MLECWNVENWNTAMMECRNIVQPDCRGSSTQYSSIPVFRFTILFKPATFRLETDHRQPFTDHFSSFALALYFSFNVTPEGPRPKRVPDSLPSSCRMTMVTPLALRIDNALCPPRTANAACAAA